MLKIIKLDKILYGDVLKTEEDIYILNMALYDELILYKNKIDNLNYNNEWDNAKKISNHYELIYLPNKKNRNSSIAFYQPISRSYFKLWEIIHDFKVFDSIKDSVSILCLAEGPGGFMEALINYRKKDSIKDTLYGITLYSYDKNIPSWKKNKKFIHSHKNIHITNGCDGTGNLYHFKNIQYLKELIKEKAYIVTGDAGFDFSIDFNKQEELSYRIIFCEIVAALHTQALNGIFICKFFDTNTLITIKYLYILSLFYNDVFITKPHTSRPANSEKYIVCKGFNHDYMYLLPIFSYYVENWDILNMDHFLSFIIVPSIFIIKIKIINSLLIKNQVNSIKLTLDLIDTHENIINSMIKKQVNLALDWCNTYNIEVNTFSPYLLNRT